MSSPYMAPPPPPTSPLTGRGRIILQKRKMLLNFKERVSVRTDRRVWIKKLISLIFWDIEASTYVVTKMHFVCPKMQKIYF